MGWFEDQEIKTSQGPKLWKIWKIGHFGKKLKKGHYIWYPSMVLETYGVKPPPLESELEGSRLVEEELEEKKGTFD